MNEPSINHFDSLKKLLEDENQDVKTQKSSAKKLGSDTILMILRMIFWRLLKSGLGGLNNIPFLMNGQTSCYHTLKWFYRVIEHKCRKKLFRILKDALSNISSRSIAIFTFRWLLPMGLLLINGA